MIRRDALLATGLELGITGSRPEEADGADSAALTRAKRDSPLVRS